MQIHSALEAAGLVAAFATVLADAGLSCNVVAGYHHDHLFVRYERVTEVMAALEALAASGWCSARQKRKHGEHPTIHASLGRQPELVEH